MVHALRARVKNGRLVLDEPIDLPEGTVVELLPADVSDELDEEDRSRLLAAIAASCAELDRGEGIPADEVLREVRAIRG
jgi:hypothetical protein